MIQGTESTIGVPIASGLPDYNVSYTSSIFRILNILKKSYRKVQMKKRERLEGFK